MKKSLFKNTIYKSILSFVNIVVPLIIGPYITRLLDPNLYGAYNKVYSIFQVFLAFASFGIYNFGVREISKVRDNKKEISKLFTNLLFISVISNVLVSIIYVVYSLINSTGITMTIYMVFLIQFMANIIYVEFVNEAIENYKFITIKSIIVKLIYFISLILFVKRPDDVVIYAIIISLTIFLNNIISFIYAKSKIKFDFSEIRIKKYLKPLLTVLIMSNVELLYGQLDRVMLGKYVSDISVTLYYIPYYIIATLVAMPYSIINVSIPRLSYLIKNEGKDKYQEKLNNSISALLFIVIPICFGVFVVSKEVILIYAGEKYIDAILPLMIACIIRIFISLESVMNNLVMYPNDKENRILKVSLVCGILNLILNSVLVFFNRFSPVTAMITTGISEIVVFVAHYFYARRKMNINIKIFTKSNLTYLILCLCFIPISLLIRWLNLGFVLTLSLIIILCGLLYIITLFVKKDNNLMFTLDKLKIKRGRI